jgi:hypothetical protein
VGVALLAHGRAKELLERPAALVAVRVHAHLSRADHVGSAGEDEDLQPLGPGRGGRGPGAEEQEAEGEDGAAEVHGGRAWPAARDVVIAWLTGFTKAQVEKHIEKKATFEAFFDAAELNPNASSIKGVICGYRVEEIENPLTRKVRYLDKLVDELARGKKMATILRT